MDSKVEKYINYIVDDLVDKTKIDPNFMWGPNSKGRVIPPWSTMYQEDVGYSFDVFPLPSILSSSYTKYVQSMYGVKSHEGRAIWDLYIKKIETLL